MPSASPDASITSRRVLLPTGQRIRFTGPVGRENVLVEPAEPGGDGPGRALISQRLPGHLYVLPAVAEPYLGRFLEPGLFDVGGSAGTDSGNARIPVRIAYQGAVPDVPGITITDGGTNDGEMKGGEMKGGRTNDGGTNDGGTATGFLTPTSAAAFGRALTAQWLTDQAAGWPERTSLFDGVTKIGTMDGEPPPATPAYPMYTVNVRTLGADGQPQPQARFGLMNVDDGRKYTGFVTAQDGAGQVSVPAGTYSAVADQFGYDPATDTTTLTISTVNEFTVTGPGRTLTLDQRTAVAEPRVSAPKPADLSAHYLEWNRRDVSSASWMSLGYFLGPGTDVRLTPAAEPVVGRVNLTQNWGLTGPVTAGEPAYTFDLASLRHRVEADPADVFTESDLATVNATYYGDGGPSVAAVLRYPLYPGAGGGAGAYDAVTRGSRRIEYVAATGTPTWTDATRLNYGSTLDPGDVDSPARLLPAGATETVDWFRGPLSAGVPQQRGAGACYACRSGDALLIGLAPVLDSDPTHHGSLYPDPDGTPVARFRLYADGSLLSDENDRLGGRFEVDAANATYTAVLDVDRRLSAAAQSTTTHSEFTFDSAADVHPPIPGEWTCEEGDCRVLPLLQARVGLATGLTGRLPAGRSPVTVSVARIQGAQSADVRTAGLEIRPAGGEWASVPLRTVSGGRYVGLLDGSAYPGVDVDLRVSATDAAGSQVRQTIERAYTVEES